jgi:hypothetical protein
MGTLAAYSAAGAGKLALAQEPLKKPAYSRAPDPIQALPVHRYAIPAGTLASVIAAFKNVSGVEVSVAEQQLLSIGSPGVSGTWTAEQALEKLLANTGLQSASQVITRWRLI